MSDFYEEKWGRDLEPGDCIADGQCWFKITGWVDPAPAEGLRRARGIWGGANGYRDFRDDERYRLRSHT